jgi:hypothetical protein
MVARIIKEVARLSSSILLLSKIHTSVEEKRYKTDIASIESNGQKIAIHEM